MAQVTYKFFKTKHKQWGLFSMIFIFEQIETMSKGVKTNVCFWWKFQFAL